MPNLTWLGVEAEYCQLQESRLSELWHRFFICFVRALIGREAMVGLNRRIFL